ncbi:MAG TPA: O-antigen ligase domain-containing protein [Flavobacteriales bacterium]|nr:O-antigen ligase domain-containing protein [Flavobacteriales bacterium]|tara:strand:+ start:115248 stop:116771 length:1524 start_codon:yes stop_codon:yes gene_type:complete
MNYDSIHRVTGADKLKHPLAIILILGIAVLCGYAAAKGGIVVAGIIGALPIGIWFMSKIIQKPFIGLMLALYMGFLLSGFARYIQGIPFGLSVDFGLALAWIGILFKDWKYTDFTPLKNDLSTIMLLWYGYIVFEIVNPESCGPAAWFYAMRGDGFYWILFITAIFMICRNPKYVDTFVNTILFFSVLGSLWGLRQLIFGVDDAEWRWLYVEGHEDQHVLFGKLRVFSYYSDAGQFGASQAQVASMCFIMALGPYSRKRKIIYLICGILTFIGFGISGTRGALAVPAVAGLLYLFLSKNFKILIIGLIMGGTAFYILKYTKAFQSIEQVARMRTGLSGEDASFLERLKNQRTFGRHLANKPIGGGVGSAGFWGEKFCPHTLMGHTPTDSWYVKIWAETGIVGICFHLFFIGYVIGKGGLIIWNLKDGKLMYKILGLYAGTGGIFLASYGNQVVGQPPSSLIMPIALALTFMAPMYDKMILQKQLKEKKAKGEPLSLEEEYLLQEPLK